MSNKNDIPQVKVRKIHYYVGHLEFLEVPTDWRKVTGIIANRSETNMGLAVRDYSVECRCGTEPLVVVEGFWIWWCKTHNQPLSICSKKRELHDLKAQIRAICEEKP